MDSVTVYSAKDWISSKMKVLDEDGIAAVLAERGILPDTPFAELTQKDKDLLLAEGLLSQILLCGSGITTSDTDGNYSHSEGGWQITKADKNAWTDLYRTLRRKWGEDVLIGKGITLQSHGFRTWRRR